MRILVAPLNWGLGHASRCVPLIQQLQSEGHEVVLGGAGESLTLLRKHFPMSDVLPLAPLELRYGSGKRQVWAMLCALPKIIVSAVRDHRMIVEYMQYEKIDEIISDNRFGLYLNKGNGGNHVADCKTVYITHQLVVPLPHGWQWLEPILAKWHKRLIDRYDECWIPDQAVGTTGQMGLAGRLAHPAVMPPNARYIGVLSRFSGKTYAVDTSYAVVAVLSGLEPQRTIFEQSICQRYENADDTVLIVRGKMQGPPTMVKHNNITIIPWLDDNHLAAFLLGAKCIICRSGYSSVMDMYALGVENKVEWHPTPGQPEQEYLAEYLKNRERNMI